MADTALPIGALDPAGALEASDKLEIERGDGGGAEGLRTSVGALRDGLVGSASVSEIWTGTQAVYDAIGTKDPSTLYVVTD